MRGPRPANSCRQCGSTNYHRVFARDGSGVLRNNGRFQCSGCQLNFTQASEWRGVAMDPSGQVCAPEMHLPAMRTLPGSAPA
jgi:hypothetical protein